MLEATNHRSIAEVAGGAIQSLKYRSVRKAAERAIKKIAPSVQASLPAWKFSDKAAESVDGLECFSKRDGVDSVSLRHSTPEGEMPERHTVVNQIGEILSVIEELSTERSTQRTEIVFTSVGVRVYSSIDRKRIRRPTLTTRRRIVRTLRPKSAAL